MFQLTHIIHAFLFYNDSIHWGKARVKFADLSVWSDPVQCFNCDLISSYICFVLCIFLSKTLTPNFQLTLHCVLPAVIDCLAHVNPAIKGTRFTDLQGQNSVLAEHPVLGLIWDVHLVLVPGHLRLMGRETDWHQDSETTRRLKTTIKEAVLWDCIANFESL